MSDHKKFLVALICSLALVVMVLAENLGAGGVLSRANEEWRRKKHYKNVIEPKGLDLHKGLYWKEKE